MTAPIILPTAAFNFRTAKSLIRKLEVGNSIVNDNTDLINYLNKYFYQINGTGDFYFYDYKEDKFIFYDKKNLCKAYIDKFDDNNLKKKMTTTNDIVYNIINDNKNKLRVFNQDDEMYINLSKYFLVTNLFKPYKDFPEDIKNKAKKFLNYIFEVLANSNNENYEYLLKWFSNMFKGNKNNSALYFKGPQGLGKTTISEFIGEFIFGDALFASVNTDPLLTQFNGELFGRLLVVFEELPTMTRGQWDTANGALNNYITNDKIIINDKFDKKFITINTNNYIINSNFDPIQHSEGRRYYIADLSTKYRNDLEYFSNLRSECFNKEVAQAVFNYIYEIDTKGFYAQNYPLTISKKEAIENRLLSEYKFIRQKYIIDNKDKKDVKILRDQLYKDYLDYVKDNDLDISPKYNNKYFFQKLREINLNIDCKISSYYLKCSYDELMKIAKREKWLVCIDLEDDNIDEKEPEPEKEAETLESKIEELKRQMEEQAKYIKMLETENKNQSKYINELENEIISLDQTEEYKEVEYKDDYNNYMEKKGNKLDREYPTFTREEYIADYSDDDIFD